MGCTDFNFPDSTDQDLVFQAQVGRALAVASRFESNCGSLQAFDSGRNPRNKLPPEVTDEERAIAGAKMLTTIFKKTLHKHAEEIAKRYAAVLEIPVEEVLIAAVKARNTIAHELAHGLADSQSSRSSWMVLQIYRLHEAVEKVALGDRLVALIFSMEFPGEQPPSPEEFQSYPQRATDWVLLGRCAKFY